MRCVDLGLCDEEMLGTGDFLATMLRDVLSPIWFPAVLFVVASLTSFATGTSWGTMAILIPTAIPIAFNLDGDVYGLTTIICLGAVLDGSIFGDHCSPISDTTILSSAASGCDHIDHVTTQLPYAGSVALVALFLGYVPIGFGFWQPMVLMPLGLIVIYLLTHFLGRPVEEYAKILSDKPIDLPDMSALIPDDEEFPDLAAAPEESSDESSAE